MSQSQLVAKIKSMQSNTPDRTKTMDQLVKLIISNRKASTNINFKLSFTLSL